MNIKKFLKKLNRGLVLAGIVLVGFIIFIIVDKKNFNKDKVVIKDTLYEYLDSMTEVMVVKESDLDENNIIKKEIREDKEKKISNLIGDKWGEAIYFTGNYSYYNDWLTSKSNVVKSIKETYGKSENPCNVISYIYNIKEIKISKYGSNGAVAKINGQDKIEVKGASEVIIPISGSVLNIYSSSLFDEYPKLRNLGKEELNKVLKNVTFDFNNQLFGHEIYLVKEDGKWKISRANDYYGGSSGYHVEDSDIELLNKYRGNVEESVGFEEVSE